MTPEETTTCAVCDHADRTGSWADCPGQEGLTHCRQCHGSWSRASELQHCMGCCRTFTSAYAADLHRDAHGHCMDPAAVFDRKGRPRLVPSTKRLRGNVTVWTGWSDASGVAHFQALKRVG